MTTIKPCPWCGSSGTLIQNSLAGPRGTGYPGCFEYFVRCVGCHAVAPYGKEDDIYQSPEQARGKAINTWNSRGGRK